MDLPDNRIEVVGESVEIAEIIFRTEIRDWSRNRFVDDRFEIFETEYRRAVGGPERQRRLHLRRQHGADRQPGIPDQSSEHVDQHLNHDFALRAALSPNLYRH